MAGEELVSYDETDIIDEDMLAKLEVRALSRTCTLDKSVLTGIVALPPNDYISSAELVTVISQAGVSAHEALLAIGELGEALAREREALEIMIDSRVGEIKSCVAELVAIEITNAVFKDPSPFIERNHNSSRKGKNRNRYWEGS